VLETTRLYRGRTSITPVVVAVVHTLYLQNPKKVLAGTVVEVLELIVQVPLVGM
jgi:hypothetical protein